jgi:hypothetical protein
MRSMMALVMAALLTGGSAAAPPPQRDKSGNAVVTSTAGTYGSAATAGHWKRAYPHRGGSQRGGPLRGASGGLDTPAPPVAAASCPDVAPLKLYRFVEGIDSCMQPLSATDIAALADPFAVNVLAPGQGNAGKWPDTVEAIVALVAAIPNFAANQHSYLLGEGSQITTAVAPRDAERNLRYVVSWGSNASPTVFLSAAPSGTHPGQPAGFLQVIGYDAARNRFNYYEYIANPGQSTRSWAFAGNSDNARNPVTAGQGCMQCHINGALNMKELTTPWNNWNSPSANISPGNIPQAVADDPLYQQVSGADRLQTSFQSLQTRYSQGLVSLSIRNGSVSNVPDLLRRLITTTTVNFVATPRAITDTVQVPSDFFLNQAAFGTSQINLAFTAPGAFTLTAARHSAFLSANAFALQQLDANNRLVYRQPGGNFFALFTPAPAYEDVAVMQQLINLKVIDANFAAAVLLVDFPNPVFSATRASLMKYAQQISTARTLGSGANPDSVPAQFIALVKAAAAGQPACDTTALLACSAEQQFLYYAGQTDWKTRATAQVNPYFAAVTQRLATDAGTRDYLTLWASRQAQFAAAPGVGNLDEFALLLPCNSLALNVCKRMNADGSIADDLQSRCMAQTCASAP